MTISFLQRVKTLCGG